MSKLLKLVNSKEGKTLLENFISLSSLQLIGMLLPLLTLPYLIRVVGISNYGIIILASTTIAYFQSITDYSFKITATRDVAVNRNSYKRLNIIFSKVLTVKLMFLLLSCLILFLIIFNYPPFYKERIIFFLTMPSLLGYAMFPEWFFLGIERMKYIALINLFVKLFFTAGVFLLINSKEDYWIYPLLQSSGYIVAAVIAQYILFKRFEVKFLWLNVSRIRQVIGDNFAIFVNQFLPNLYNNTSTLLLGLFNSTSLVGIYDAIKKVIDVNIILIGVLSRVCFPIINKKNEVFSTYKKVMLFLGFILMLLPIVFSKFVLLYLGVDYEMSFTILFILSLGIYGYTLYDVYGVNYFIVKRKDKLVMKNTILASVIGFITAFPLIYFLGIFGAAFNLTISRFLMGGTLMYKWLKDESI